MQKISLQAISLVCALGVFTVFTLAPKGEAWAEEKRGYEVKKKKARKNLDELKRTSPVDYKKVVEFRRIKEKIADSYRVSLKYDADRKALVFVAGANGAVAGTDWDVFDGLSSDSIIGLRLESVSFGGDSRELNELLKERFPAAMEISEVGPRYVWTIKELNELDIGWLRDTLGTKSAIREIKITTPIKDHRYFETASNGGSSVLNGLWWGM